MVAYDFEYDGKTLKELGYIICTFDKSGNSNTVSNGSVISFNTVSMFEGQRFDKVSSKYESTLSNTFGIIKFSGCNGGNDDKEMSLDEQRFMMKWLNRKSYHKLTFIDETGDYMKVHYNASFNVSRVESGGRVIGMELTVNTDRPFAYGDEVENIYEGSQANWTFSHDDLSDELGFLYPKVKFTASSAGTLTIYSAKEDRTTKINNVTSGEVITMEYPMITSSNNSHAIQNDFNWNFFRLSEDFESTLNEITVSLPGTFKMSYTPIVKIGL